MTDNQVSNIVFLGTPEFALPTLNAIYAAPGFHIAAVITQPDRPAGRGKKLQPPPVKVQCEAWGDVPFFQTASIKKDKELQLKLHNLAPDFFVTVAFGQILDETVLSIPKYGTVNAHASILPKYRGANPIQHAILDGETATGITTMLTELGVDTGPILAVETTPIETEDTLGTLTKKLSTMSGPLVVKTLDGILSGDIIPSKQDDTLSSHAPKCQKSDAMIQWHASAVAIQRKIRAFNPTPRATTALWIKDHHEQSQEMQLKILSSQCIANSEKLSDSLKKLQPGQCHITEDHRVLVQTSEGVLEILSLQPPGKKEMPVKQWIQGIQNKYKLTAASLIFSLPDASL
ncbi:MAG: methionyl-tRNA formyltransferase [Cyanobacteria bacterium P01_H01_bin.74]